MSVQDLALQRDKYRHLTDEEWRWFLQQVEGRERTEDKLPTFAQIEDWWYPVRLSCEQCSSEQAAKYKASLTRGEKMVDLTGGYGVDTYFLNDSFSSIDYVEQNEELCRIAAHNFANRPIAIHNTSAEDFLQTAGEYDLIFLDPARRDSHGGKVFRLEDCTPNVVELLPTLLRHGKQIMLKLSPMLDLTQAVRELSAVSIQLSDIVWDCHIVAIKNEVKEVLVVSRLSLEDRPQTITCIDLVEPEKAFVFTKEQETNCPLAINPSPFAFIYEPNAAILKAGAYKLVGARYGLQKLDVNTHLYTSERLVTDFPGRKWKIEQVVRDRKDLPAELKQANVLTRNYPMTPEQLKKKLHLRDGGTAYLIGARIQGKPTVLRATLIP
jgi:hypothetical protein